MSKLTGYPSIDKPWLQFYTEDQINASLPECSIYQYIWENNKDYLDNVALNYFDRKITYQEMFSGITAVSKAYQALGISEGDIVSVITVTLPETIYTFYGLNRIGAISNMIDPRTSEEGIRSYVSEVNSKVVVVIDAAYERVKKAVKGTSVEQIIVLSPADSLPFPKKQIYNLSKRKNRNLYDRAMSWKKFISVGENQVLKEAIYQKNKCCVIVHTGGTTGTPKGVMLSDDNLNAATSQALCSPLPLKRQDVFLNIMPPFIAYGVVLGIHTALCGGWKIIDIPVFDEDKFADLVAKHKPAGIMGVPTYFEKLMNHSKMENGKLDFLKVVLVGGDKLNPEFEIRINEWLKTHGAQIEISKGYSMTEASSTATFSFANSNEIGSAGIPLSKTIVSAFNSAGEEVGFDEIGELRINSPTIMLGYYDNDSATKEIILEKDGVKWVKTGDIGYISESGNVYVQGRNKRMIIRYDGFKVFAPLVEEVIATVSGISDVCVVGKDDMDHEQGQVPVAFVVTSCESKEVRSRIITECKKKLPDYAQPDKICFIDELPLTPIGKVDYRALEQ